MILFLEICIKEHVIKKEGEVLFCERLTWDDCEVSRPVVETPPRVGHKANVHSRIGTGNPSEVNKVLERCRFLYNGEERYLNSS